MGHGQGGVPGEGLLSQGPPSAAPPAGCGLPGEADPCTPRVGMRVRGPDTGLRQAESSGCWQPHLGVLTILGKVDNKPGVKARGWPPPAASGSCPRPSAPSLSWKARVQLQLAFRGALAPRLPAGTEGGTEQGGQVSPLPYCTRLRTSTVAAGATTGLLDLPRHRLGESSKGNAMCCSPTSCPRPAGPFLVSIMSPSRSLVPRMGVTHADQPECSGPGEGPPSVTAQGLRVLGQLLSTHPRGETFPGDLPDT